MKKVCVCTGTRAEYGLQKPVMLDIKKSKKLKLQLVVSGMHLLPRFGNSIEQIEKDGFKADEKLDIFVDNDSGLAAAQSIGNGLKTFAEAFDRLKPDVVMLLGDRMETFAAAVAASAMNIPIAHIHGGDTAQGGLDEIFRHCISKFSHLHLAATEKSASKIGKIGEEKWRIHVVGAPGLDDIKEKRFTAKKELCKKLELDCGKPVLLVLQHSVSTQPENAGRQIAETMKAVKELGMQTVVIYPNSDQGGRAIIEEIEKNKKLPFIKVFKNLGRQDFLGMMNLASAMVGNSSAAIIESALFRLPVVNVGERQKGRERSDNVLDAGYKSDEIAEAIKKALKDKDFLEKVEKSQSPYGQGRTGRKIVEILERLKIDERLLQKRMV